MASWVGRGEWVIVITQERGWQSNRPARSTVIVTQDRGRQSNRPARSTAVFITQDRGPALPITEYSARPLFPHFLKEWRSVAAATVTLPGGTA
jgi:hypothetical protein